MHIVLINDLKRLDLSKLQTHPLFGRLIGVSVDRRNKDPISYPINSDLDIEIPIE
jgi:hypothetical protein